MYSSAEQKSKYSCSRSFFGMYDSLIQWNVEHLWPISKQYLIGMR